MALYDVIYLIPVQFKECFLSPNIRESTGITS